MIPLGKQIENLKTEVTKKIEVKEITASDMEELKNYLKNNAPIGISIYEAYTGSKFAVIVQKMNANYLTLLVFGYSDNLTQYRCYNGKWVA